MGYDFHDIADIFPMLGDADLKALAADIKATGLIEPIKLYEGRILDGRNRYRACALAGITLQDEDYVVFQGDWATAARHVASENIHRRHLTDAQRASCAAKLATLGRGRPKKDDNTGENNGAIAPFSRADAAAALNVSLDSVKRARRVQQHAVPELAAAVDSGQVSLRAAETIVTLPPAEQATAVAAGPAAVKQAAAKVRATPKPKKQLTQAQKDIAARKQVDQLLQGLITILQATKQAAAQIAEDPSALAGEDKITVLVAAGELRFVADWLESIANGVPVSDTAIAELLDTEDNE